MANEIITINESEYNAILRQVVAVIEDSKFLQIREQRKSNINY